MAGFTVGFPAGSMVAVVALLLGHVGDNGCSDGKLRSALAMPRSGVDGLALIAVVKTFVRLFGLGSGDASRRYPLGGVVVELRSLRSGSVVFGLF